MDRGCIHLFIILTMLNLYPSADVGMYVAERFPFY